MISPALQVLPTSGQRGMGVLCGILLTLRIAFSSVCTTYPGIFFQRRPIRVQNFSRPTVFGRRQAGSTARKYQFKLALKFMRPFKTKSDPKSSLVTYSFAIEINNH